MEAIEFYSFVMNPPEMHRNADNNINEDGLDDGLQMIQEIKQI
jgi:hypothetical protein